MGSHISPYSNGFSWWSQRVVGASEQMQVALAAVQLKLQVLLASYIDSFYFFGVLLMFLVWVPFKLKQPDNTSTSGLHT